MQKWFDTYLGEGKGISTKEDVSTFLNMVYPNEFDALRSRLLETPPPAINDSNINNLDAMKNLLEFDSDTDSDCAPTPLFTSHKKAPTPLVTSHKKNDKQNEFVDKEKQAPLIDKDKPTGDKGKESKVK